MSTKLNQMLAVRKGLAQRTTRATTDIYHALQKPALYAGLTRTYQPKDEEGEPLPSERQHVQRRVENDLQEVGRLITKQLDAQLTVDCANQSASADVVIDGHTLIAAAPVPFLLSLDKQLEDLRTVVSAVPTLAPDREWIEDENTGGYRTAVATTTRTRKVPRNHVKAEATDRHPAQVEIFMEDVIVGTWSAIGHSGAIPETRKAHILSRIAKLTDAVRLAVEKANDMEVTQQTAGEDIFAFLLD